jgi:ribosomal-protein-alanine N-acetyltransferase
MENVTRPAARRLDASMVDALLEVFDDLDESDRQFFHPHGLERGDAEALCVYAGEDEYRVFAEHGRVLVYGILRGWEEGYDVPSIGVAVRREVRGRGLASQMMESMHDVAFERGAAKVRARVHSENKASRRMCETLGYEFGGEERGQALGFLDLHVRARRTRK